jgi:hypothetical protein
LGAAAALVMLAGCAGEGHGGDPGAMPLAPGQTCGSIRQELNRLDSQGAQAKVEAATEGKKLSAADRAVADRYNSLLNQYLGARCHVAQSPERGMGAVARAAMAIPAEAAAGPGPAAGRG